MPAERTIDERLSAVERTLGSQDRSGRDAGRTDESETPAPGTQRRGRSSEPTPVRDPAGKSDSTVQDSSPEGTGSPDTAETGSIGSTSADEPGHTTATPDSGKIHAASDSGPTNSSPNSGAANPSAESVEDRLAALEADVAELQAGLAALRGYVGNVDHVNQSVERRANAAIAAVERLESAPKTPPDLATVGTGDSDPETDPAPDDRPHSESDEDHRTSFVERVNALL